MVAVGRGTWCGGTASIVWSASFGRFGKYYRLIVNGITLWSVDVDAPMIARKAFF